MYRSGREVSLRDSGICNQMLWGRGLSWKQSPLVSGELYVQTSRAKQGWTA